MYTVDGEHGPPNDILPPRYCKLRRSKVHSDFFFKYSIFKENLNASRPSEHPTQREKCQNV